MHAMGTARPFADIPHINWNSKTDDFPIYPSDSTTQTSIKYALGIFCGVFPKNTPMGVFTDGLLYGGSR